MCVELTVQANLKKLVNLILYFHVIDNRFLDYFLNLSNNYTHLIRVLSFIFRFFQNCRSKERATCPLHSYVINQAEISLIKIVQSQEFKNELTSLQKDGQVLTNSKLKNLLPFLDENCILRVGGRLANSKFNYNKKFSILLPKTHRLTILFVVMFHKNHNFKNNFIKHIGSQGLMFLVRQKFWAI